MHRTSPPTRRDRHLAGRLSLATALALLALLGPGCAGLDDDAAPEEPAQSGGEAPRAHPPAVAQGMTGGPGTPSPPTGEGAPRPSRIETSPDAGGARGDARPTDALPSGRTDAPAGARPDALPAAPAQPATPLSPAVPGAPAPAFDLSRLHLVLVTSTREGDLRNSRTDVPCDVVFDGVELPKSLCHRKGSYGSLSQSKPALNIKFDAVVPQKLPGGISHIILNNAQQDPSLLNEHLGYEIYRRAGQAAPLTAHALVSLNGKPLGLYVIKEHIGKDFLGRSFGKAEREGNLYKAPLHVDFAKYPDRMDLKNEKEDLRSRTDMRAAAAAVKNPTAAAFEETASKTLDLDQFITTMALDGILHHRDGPHGQSNNYYMFHRKADDRFVMLPHGMDFLFSSDYPLADDFNAKLDPFAPLGNSGLVEPMLFSWRVRSTPALMARFKATVGKLIRSAWIPAELQARIDQVVAVIRQNTDQSKVVLDQIKRFDEFVPRWRQLVGARKAFVESVAPQN